MAKNAGRQMRGRSGARGSAAPDREAKAGAVGGQLSIGALSRATGVPVPTLRTWERRYGFPRPDRRESGQRVYPLASVARVQQIARALALGHRAAEVLRASEDELRELCRLTQPSPPTAPAPHAPHTSTLVAAIGLDAGELVDSLMDAVRTYDTNRLLRILLAEWSRATPLSFLGRSVAPLIHAVGTEWARGTLEIRHEHFVSEKLSDLLRALRLPLEETARGPLVVLTTLPGEHHSLGLQMAAMVLSAAGCRVLNMGTETPPEDVVTLSRELQACAVGISVSAANDGPALATALAALRRELPPEVTLLIGGDGAPAIEGAQVLRDLEVLDAWARARVTAG